MPISIFDPRTYRTNLITAVAASILLFSTGCGSMLRAQKPTADLSNAVIVHPANHPRLAAAAQMLQYEIQRRTAIKLAVTTSMPSDKVPAIVVATTGNYPVSSQLSAAFAVPAKAEGYAIRVNMTSRSAPTVYLVGRDDRGALFAAGRLVRLLNLSHDYISLTEHVRIATAPDDAIRAHQIISSTQSKDGFVDWHDAAQKQQYIRDMVLFGTNGFEPRPAGDVDDYMEQLGIDLFGKITCQNIIDYAKLTDDQIRKLYTDLVGVDHFTTYGGDASGSRPPMEFFPQMERVIPLILESHPGAKWWYSNQCLKKHAVDYDDYIFNYFKTKQPSWLYGMVYGPWTKRGIKEIRADLPPQYKIRHYPEICHVRWCQYPVRQWDRVWAQLWPRNHSIYAMPRMMAQIHRATRKDTVGFLPYNHTGTYNDLNKFAWSAVGWDTDAKIEDVLYDYGKAFFAYDFEKNPAGGSASKDAIIEGGAAAVARGLMLLDENWTGHLADNKSAIKAKKLWKKIAASMGGVGKNWRLEMFLYKAVLDAQVKRKYDAEMQCQRHAYAALKKAENIGVAKAVADARSELAKIDTEFQSREAFMQELKSLGLTNKFGDLDEVVNNIYSPLSDRKWIESQLDNVTSLADINRIINYEDAGPGGFYDNLGVEGQQPHLVKQKTWQQDPGFVYSPVDWLDYKPGTDKRHSQQTHAVCRYSTPILMRWQGLDRTASYHINVVYRGPFGPEFTCKTDEGYVIHGPRGNTESAPVSYSIPKPATSDGLLELKWQLTNQVRGVSVTEIWLIKD